MEKKMKLSINETAADYAAIVHHQLKTGTKEDIMQLLQDKINSCYTSETGDTFLHTILRNEKLSEEHVIGCLRTFVDQGIDPHIQNKNGNTALHVAIERKMKGAVDLLLEYEVKILDQSGNSILHFFVENEHKRNRLHSTTNTTEDLKQTENVSVRLLKFLLSKDVDFDRKNDQEKSALDLAIEYYQPNIILTLLEPARDKIFTYEYKMTLLFLFLKRRSQLFGEQRYSNYSSRHAITIVQILLNKIIGDNRKCPLKVAVSGACTLISNAIKWKEEQTIVGVLIKYYLQSYSDVDIASPLFLKILSTCESWSILNNDYYLTVLRNLMDRGAKKYSKSVYDKLYYEEQTQKRIELGEWQRENVYLLNLLKEYEFDFIIRSRHDKSLLHLLVKQSHDKGSSIQFYMRVQEEITKSAFEVYVVDEQGKSAFQLAAAYGDKQIVQLLLESGAKINHRDDNKSSSLHDAVINNQTKMVKLLLLNGADVNCKDEFQQTPLHCASQLKKAAEIVEFLLTNGADPDAKNSKGQTPLHVSACSSNPAIVELLFKYGAFVDAKDVSQKTPLDRALELKSTVETVKALLTGGASVDTRDESQRTVLHRAIKMNASVKTVAELLNNGVDANATNLKGETALHLAVFSNNSAIAQLLIMCGRAHVNAKDYRHRTPLHYAAIIHTNDIILLLVDNGADLCAEDNESKTPLHFAVKLVCFTNIEIVRLLIQRGAPINCKDKCKRTPLHYVRSLEIYEVLLEAGADFNCKDDEGNTAIHLIIQLSVLRNNCERCSPNGDGLSRRVLNRLLQAGARFNVRNYRGESALYHAQSCLSFKNITSLHYQWRNMSEASWINLIRFKAAGLPFDEDREMNIGDDIGDKEFYEYCLTEVEKLKKTFIDDENTSLLDFLKMSLRGRIDYVSSKKLQEIVESPQFVQQFLAYSSIILPSYREALTRMRAEQAMRAMTQIRLPEMIDKLLSYLTGADVMNLIKAHNRDST